MNHEMLPQNEECLMAKTAPSAEFINAISDFLNTDPSDLLLELGYYTRDHSGNAEQALAEANQ